MNKKLLSFLLLGGSFASHAQFTEVHPDSVHIKSSEWETGYLARVTEMANAYTYSKGNGSAGVDDGKHLWPRLLSQLWKLRNDNMGQQNLINTHGKDLLNATWSGSFCGPFSGPGLVYYYSQYKSMLPQEQKDRVTNYMNNTGNYPYRCPNGKNGWHFLMRPDHQMDPVYNTENPETNPANKYEGTEKNSENYHWMLRMPGYVLAEDLSDTTKTDEKERYLFFRSFVKNWVRALYNAGRIEWNSNNYWGHTWQPNLTLYDQAKDTTIRKMAKAGLDWNLMEAALHYIDGMQAGADVRAKVNAYRLFEGSTWGYTYFYFADNAHLPSYYTPGVFNSKSVNDYIGYAPTSSYRPAQAIVDIAQRKYTMPVEIQSAKPFYALDKNEYADWKGNTVNSRRFEFESLWLDSNMLLSSVATNIPDGWVECDKQRPFSEQSLWRLAAKGSNGPVQIYGNSGVEDNSWKRHVMRNPKEQIGQFRNMMVRMVQNIDSMWVEIPTAVSTEYDGNKLYVNLGNNVYAAITPNNELSKSSRPSADANYTRYTWTYSPSTTGALILETGTGRAYADYITFKNEIKNNSVLTVPSAKTISYTGAAGHTIVMEYNTDIVDFVMQTPVTPACTVANAGTVPKVWGNGNYIDYSTWDSYRTVYGTDIVNQKWGSGELYIRSDENALKIKIDETTANPTYYTFDPGLPLSQSTDNEWLKNKDIFTLHPNPATDVLKLNLLSVQEEPYLIAIKDLTGVVVYSGTANGEITELPLNHLNPGMYIITVKNSKIGESKKFIKR